MSNVRRIQERHRARPRNAGKAGPKVDPWRDDYWTLSRLPLHAVVFLIPLIVLYELGSVYYLRDPAAGLTTQIRAESLLNLFFESFGVLGAMVPGISLAVVLLVLHMIRRDRWAVRPMVVTGMYLESAVWVLPLIVLAAVVTDAAARVHAGAPGGSELTDALAAQTGGAGDGLRSMSLPARATVAVGAGVYEELLFRLILIAGLDALLGLVVQSRATRTVACVVLTSLAFAAYHDASFRPDAMTGGSGFFSVVHTLMHDGPAAALARVYWGRAVFFFVAGVYFSCIYMARGFGVVVGTHAAYDLAVLVLFAGRG